MRLPPAWLRRPPAMVGLALVAVVVVVLLPVLLVLGLLGAALLPRRRQRALRLAAFALVYLLVEVVGLLAALVLWVACGFGTRLRTQRWQSVHYAVLGRILAVVLRAAERLFRLEIVTDDLGWSPLDDGTPGSENAMVVLSRHAGPGDSLLLVRTLMDRDHLRRPRIVLKAALQWDPLLDVYLNRLPNAFLVTGGEDSAERIAELAADLGDQDALLLFPEGGNFSEGRRARAITRLRQKGMVEEAERAEALVHVLPPRTTGVAAATTASPHADVVLVAHTGLEHLSTAADLWAGLPMDSSVRIRWDFVPAAEVPREREALDDWLYERWAEVDRWIARGGHDRS